MYKGNWKLKNARTSPYNGTSEISLIIIAVSIMFMQTLAPIRGGGGKSKCSIALPPWPPEKSTLYGGPFSYFFSAFRALFLCVGVFQLLFLSICFFNPCGGLFCPYEGPFWACPLPAIRKFVRRPCMQMLRTIRVTIYTLTAEVELYKWHILTVLICFRRSVYGMLLFILFITQNPHAFLGHCESFVSNDKQLVCFNIILS